MFDLREFETEAQKIVGFMQTEFASLQVGRASVTLVENIKVNCYGGEQPIKAVANLNVMDAKTISIQPWDKSLVDAVARAIQEANLGINPINDGVNVRLNIPPLTEERRQELVKIVRKYAEETRIKVRSLRQAHLHKIEEEKPSEDEQHRLEKQLQEKVEKINEQIEELLKRKEEEVLKI